MPKVSPLSWACERGEYPHWGACKNRTLEGCPSNEESLVLGHSSRVRLLSDPNPGVSATLKPPGYRAVTPSASLSEWNPTLVILFPTLVIFLPRHGNIFSRHKNTFSRHKNIFFRHEKMDMLFTKKEEKVSPLLFIYWLLLHQNLLVVHQISAGR